jgi:mRNA-degrading endonuclease RelE of RelBE toxin-antitoxin system
LERSNGSNKKNVVQVTPYSVSFSKKALSDIQQTINYYEAIQEGLGEKFRINLTAVLERIRRNGKFASIRYDNIRCARVRRFPFLVHYQIFSNNNVLIVAVYSTYQKPLWEE